MKQQDTGINIWILHFVGLLFILSHLPQISPCFAIRIDRTVQDTLFSHANVWIKSVSHCISYTLERFRRSGCSNTYQEALLNTGIHYKRFNLIENLNDYKKSETSRQYCYHAWNVTSLSTSGFAQPAHFGCSCNIPPSEDIMFTRGELQP